MPSCPLCGSQQFQAMTRTIARRIREGQVADSPSRNANICSGCGSYPRTRLLYAALDHLGLLIRGRRVLHIAAEPSLAAKLSTIYADGYHAANISLEAMEHLGAIRKIFFDMCRTPSDKLRFDIIIHSHVLEHVHCNWALALMRLNEMLIPGGAHIFCVPVRDAGHYKEDLDPHLSETIRVEQFGQFDHVRNFIADTFVDEVKELARLTGHDLTLAGAMLGRRAMQRIGASGYVFILRRPAQ
jgi:SAM-dependent methyltransferase